MRTVLVTAFEPFGKDIENAAALVCGALPDQGCFLESPAAFESEERFIGQNAFIGRDSGRLSNCKTDPADGI